MITIKDEKEIELLRKAGNIVYLTHQYLKGFLKPGVTTLELDKLAYDFILSKNASPSFLNYNGFPGSICTSINDEVVHGIPSKRKLKNGDIISIDIGACYQGYHGDSAWSYPVGKVRNDINYLLIHTEKALMKGLEQVKSGSYVSDIGKAVEAYAKEHHLGVVKELVGHGVGNHLHEDPEIPNYDTHQKGSMLKEGMVIAVEPMLNLGTARIYILEDDWTIITADSKPSAHFEHTVLVTKDGYEILTGKGDNNE